ncbi:MAG: N-acetyltransferase [Archaeoglobaceae archaeon]
MDVKIRKEEEKDRKRVYEVNRLAFQQEDESKLVENLRKSESFVPDLSLVAEVGNEVVGHILFTRIKIAGESVFDSLILAPMAVIPEFQRRGIGSKLTTCWNPFLTDRGRSQ